MPEMTPKSVPLGHHTATPYLIVRNAVGAIEFYKNAFGATELMRLTDPKGRIAHAEIQIGDTPVMLTEEVPEWGNFSPQSFAGSASHIHLYLDNVDEVTARAVAAGAKLLVPVSDQFYGDRTGRVADPFGHVWIIATHQEDVALDEMHRRFNALLGQSPA
jgi:PhnB protein